MPEGIAVLDDLYARWRAPIDPTAIAALFAVDGVWHNMMNPPLTGRAQIEAAIAGMSRSVEDVEFTTVASAAAGNVALVERVDWITWSDGTRVGLPVTGVFELDDDGLIAAWRDYYDAGWLDEQTQLLRSA
ncbi:MAG: limonene-1,2-epoxide hydrolase family protein [Microbacteriaceae bacterium]